LAYLSIPRLSFSGQFQADVSTVNNDVRHYSNDFFEPRFQDVTGPAEGNRALQNGWWNPAGTGAFRLVGTKVTQAVIGAGVLEDAAAGLDINAQVERSAAKLVDLDPQMQMVSTIFGMRVVLSRDGVEIMRGDYAPSPFRDIFFGRIAGVGGSSGASAKFTSVLTGVTWAPDMPDFQVLTALRDATTANGDTLSVNFMTTLFQHAPPYLGLLTGSIGTYRTGAPKTFVAGRRFAVASGNVSTQAGVGALDAVVAEDKATVSVDLSNAMPIATLQGVLGNLGDLSLVVLKTPDGGSPQSGVSAGVSEGATIAKTDASVIGAIPGYTAPGWLAQTAGLVDFAVPAEAQGLIADHPLALVRAQGDSFQVLIREAVGGLAVRADDFVIRMDTVKVGDVRADCTLYATHWGAPAALPYKLSVQAGGSGGGGGPDNQDIAPPQAPIPDIGPPPAGQGSSAVTLGSGGTTGADGTATVAIFGTDPGNPRKYLDGQIYQVNYVLDIAGVSPLAPLDAIFLHLRDAYEAPEHPDWLTDIAPFMQQYDNLYPVMSRNLFSLADPAVAEQHARLLIFAFDRPLDDPNHMPATRDLSAGKREAVVRWLASKIPGYAGAGVPQPEAVVAETMPETAPVGRLSPLSNEVIDAALSQLGEGTDGKVQAMRDYLVSQRHG
jgi:hypothetical protein